MGCELATWVCPKMDGTRISHSTHNGDVFFNHGGGSGCGPCSPTDSCNWGFIFFFGKLSGPSDAKC